MTGSYIIRPLPNSSIVERQKKNGKLIPWFEIPNGTFEDINTDLKIRPRSVLFAQESKSDVFVALYKDSDKSECLFFFKFVPTNLGLALHICRCLGKSKVKHHWKPFLDYIS